MEPTKPQAIELPMRWYVCQYIPRNRLRLAIARCNSRVEACQLMEAKIAADAALRPCLSVHRDTDLHLIQGRTELQVPA